MSVLFKCKIENAVVGWLGGAGDRFLPENSKAEVMWQQGLCWEQRGLRARPGWLRGADLCARKHCWLLMGFFLFNIIHFLTPYNSKGDLKS